MPKREQDVARSCLNQSEGTDAQIIHEKIAHFYQETLCPGHGRPGLNLDRNKETELRVSYATDGNLGANL
jgi:hypothetical protein